MKQLTIGFIGLGLIGGSIAKAIRKYHPASVIIAYDIDHDSLAKAKNDGIVTEICHEISHPFLSCDYIFLCAPVSKNSENAKALLPFLSQSCILTDVGSVKGSIHKTFSALASACYFIGGHPMTGSEKSEYSNASERLLENAYYILTPEEHVPIEKIQEFKTFIASLNALPIVLNVDLHDTVTAAVSHLPHIVAVSLVHFLISHDGQEHYMKTLAAGGFKDMTRIASSNVRMWEDICMTNQEKIDRMLTDFIEELSDVQKRIASKNRLEIGSFFQEAKDYRDSMSDHTQGLIQKVFALYCDIPDETGCIAKIAVLLAEDDISIKNIGIIHNREFEEGVLRMEFYNELSSKKALLLLKENGYSVIERN